MSPATRDDDERQFPLLAQYLEQIQSGERPDRQLLLANHPELAGVIDCLEALESLAPPPSPPPWEQEVQDALQTIPLGSSLAVSHVPAEFGDYAILEELGRGGMGVVYRARQKSLDRQVALKMILASHLASADQVRRFQAEAKAAAGVNHPHVVRIYEVGQHQGQHYFAMEYVAGESLAAKLAREQLPPREAVSLLVAVADAVQHLHERGIVHRDLKPLNILIDQAGRAVVTDFGLAKSFSSDSELTATGAIVGTPPYMAPEQASGRGELIGPKTDVYALGAVLYELLTGQPPFRDENPAITLLQVMEKEPISPRRINPKAPRTLELICLKCLEKSPAMRYASAADVAEDLRRFLDGDDVLAKPPDLVRRIVRWVRRRPALAMRMTALSCFYAVESWNYFGRGAVTAQFHWSVTAIAGVWGLCALAFQKLQHLPRWSYAALFAAAGADVLLLLAALHLADGVDSPMVFALFVMTAASALWFHRRLVWFTTALCTMAYLALVWEAAAPESELSASARDPLRHVFFVVSLILTGVVAAYQVDRINSLNRYFENRKQS